MAEEKISQLEEEVKRLKARLDALMKKYHDHSHAIVTGEDEDTGLATLQVGSIYEEDLAEPEEQK